MQRLAHQLATKPLLQQRLSPLIEQQLRLLEMPLWQLAEWLESPQTEVETIAGSFPAPEQFDDPAAPTLSYETLLAQLTPHLKSSEERRCAELILGSLDERGMLNNWDEVVARYGEVACRLHQLITHLEPLGIGSRGVQEYWLLLLKERGAMESLAYRIVQKGFPLFLHHKWEQLARLLKCSMNQLRSAIFDTLAKLPKRPIDRAEVAASLPNRPDLIIEEIDEMLTVSVHEPPFLEERIEALPLFFEGQLRQALAKRGVTLLAIGRYLLARQSSFFFGESPVLLPLSQAELARELKLHPSTISRAIKGKILSTPSGRLMELEEFFSKSQGRGESASLSESALRLLLLRILSEEKGKEPLSDTAIAKRLSELGIQLARRTVAKYRARFQIPPASLRSRRP